jgi:hypothetical protein
MIAGFVLFSEGVKMKKIISIFSFVIFIFLAIPVFRFICEKFMKCEIMQVYTVLTDRDLILERMVL